MTAARLQGCKEDVFFCGCIACCFEFGHAVLPDKLSYYATVVIIIIEAKTFLYGGGRGASSWFNEGGREGRWGGEGGRRGGEGGRGWQLGRQGSVEGGREDGSYIILSLQGNGDIRLATACTRCCCRVVVACTADYSLAQYTPVIMLRQTIMYKLCRLLYSVRVTFALRALENISGAACILGGRGCRS